MPSEHEIQPQSSRAFCEIVPRKTNATNDMLACALVVMVPCSILARCSTRARTVLPGKDMGVERVGPIALEMPWLHPVSNELIATIYRRYSSRGDGSEVAGRLHGASREFGL